MAFNDFCERSYELIIVYMLTLDYHHFDTSKVNPSTLKLHKLHWATSILVHRYRFKRAKKAIVIIQKWVKNTIKKTKLSYIHIQV